MKESVASGDAGAGGAGGDGPSAGSRGEANQAQAVSRLAAQVAHELNNPLDAVLRFVSLAQRKAKSGNYTDLQRHLADAQFGLERMADVLRELMEVGREANDLLAKGSTLPLGESIDRAIRATAAQAEEKSVAIRVDNLVPPAREPRIDQRLAQVLANVLKNAIEASPASSSVCLQAQLATPVELELEINDEGPGISAEVLPRLFTPFVTTKPKGLGNGLGLAISREMIHSLGGTLSLNNRDSGAGCCARIRLAVSEAPISPASS